MYNSSLVVNHSCLLPHHCGHFVHVAYIYILCTSEQGIIAFHIPVPEDLLDMVDLLDRVFIQPCVCCIREEIGVWVTSVAGGMSVWRCSELAPRSLAAVSGMGFNTWCYFNLSVYEPLSHDLGRPLIFPQYICNIKP